jgi:aminoglycoside phosphotransferase (APT) family kinase protein
MTIPTIRAMPEADIHIDEALILDLLKDQHPEFAAMEIEFHASGWDNMMYRLGSDLCVRLPRRKAAASLIINEQQWLPFLAPQLPLPVPCPLKTGGPSGTYPWKWSIIPWFSGKSADQTEINTQNASELGAFLKALHIPAPDNAPENPFRGVPLHQRAQGVEERLNRLRQKTDLITPRILNHWAAGVKASYNENRPKCWLHGDLHPQNIIVNPNGVTAVIDWGDMTSGDTATDLALAWMLFQQPENRRIFLESSSNGHNHSEAVLNRAAGWAVLFGVVLLETGMANNPRHEAMGRRILRNLERG